MFSSFSKDRIDQSQSCSLLTLEWCLYLSNCLTNFLQQQGSHHAFYQLDLTLKKGTHGPLSDFPLEFPCCIQKTEHSPTTRERVGSCETQMRQQMTCKPFTELPGHYMSRRYTSSDIRNTLHVLQELPQHQWRAEIMYLLLPNRLILHCTLCTRMCFHVQVGV